MSLARNVATVGGITLLSRVLGFVRDVLIAAALGTGIVADAFFVAFQVANLARRLLAEGALNAAIVPLYLRARDHGGEGAAAAFAGELAGTLTICMTALALLLAFLGPIVVLFLAPGFTPHGPRLDAGVDLLRLTLPYLAFAAPVAVLMSVLNANHRFAPAALGTVAFNATMLAVLFLILKLRGGDSLSGRLLAGGVALAGMAQMGLVVTAVWIGPERVAPLRIAFGRAMRRFLTLAIPALIATGIPQIAIIGGVMVASESQSAVSWLYYANRLVELPLGVVGIAVGTVLVPALTHALRSGDRAELAAAESRGIELALGLTLPAAIALAILARPTVGVLFQHGAFTAADAAETAAALVAFSFGLPGHVLVKALAPAFFAREDTTTPMHAALLGFAAALAGSLVLFPIFGHVGVAAAIALSGWIAAALLGLLIGRRGEFLLDGAARRRLPRIVAAGCVMGIVVAVANKFMGATLAAGGPEGALALFGIIAAGLLTYTVLTHVLGIATMRQLFAGLGGKL